MKKAVTKKLTLIIILLAGLLSNDIYAQAPQAIPYQGVARNAAGNILASQPIGLLINIHDVTSTGTIVYSETQTITTSTLGLFTVNIGAGTAITGTLAGVNWGSGAKFIDVEMDATGGTNYVDMGTTQLMSVPYALFAGNGGSPSSAWSLTGNAGTTGANFIGTTDQQPLIFEAFGSTAGFIGKNNNTAFGVGTLYGIIEADNNTALGYNAGSNLAEGSHNIAIGSGAQLPNSFGSNQLSIGNWIYGNNGNIGIGTATPNAFFNVAEGQTVLFGTDTISAENKLMWLPSKGAFRVGHYSGSTNDPIGLYSTAMGLCTASGPYSTAMGDDCTASGFGSTAMGSVSSASGSYSTAMGASIATENGSTAMGTSTASGSYSTAMGDYSTASGYGSIAMGASTASAQYSTSMGFETVAKSQNETVIGTFNDTSNTNRLFEIGDGALLHNSNALTVLNNGMVGIGTTNPNASFNISEEQTVLFGTDTTSAGNKLMWLPTKGAFRAGYYSSLTYDPIGLYSVAMGQSTASGRASTGLGQGIASGDFSIATSDGTAIGILSTAMGQGTANGDYSTAMGISTTASGTYSTAMGYLVSTNGHTGSFVIGDSDPLRGDTTKVGVDDQFVARFHGGYYLETTSNATRTGVYMNSGDNSWSAISDSTKKENKLAIDGEDLLHKISQFKLGTWNYKGQDPKIFRHYGPMAQDFHNAFGKDALGTIGCDTLINQQDFLGVSFIAIQALEKRTEKIEALQKQNIALQQQVDKQQDNLAMKQQMQQQIDTQQQQMQTLLNTVATLNKQVQALAARTDDKNTIAENK
jgi:hypothetical protein